MAGEWKFTGEAQNAHGLGEMSPEGTVPRWRRSGQLKNGVSAVSPRAHGSVLARWSGTCYV
jgi:hypothetical protein